ncbi:copper resistance protein NlpE [Reichenbachiella sp. MALMAid0571]|uniref:copper resistance protein NlpE n=1 Tax=Reichenbachiella sp. MALMAid0571 TaxID=3143939 RepID=UPI0032DF8112
MVKKTLYPFLLILVLTNCKDQIVLTEGTYSGTLPCADCEAINYVLTLNRNMTYTENILYIGKSESKETNSGTYAIKNDSVVWLQNKNKGMNQFAIGNQKLEMLDISGQRIKSSFADKYILSKTKP